MKPNARKYAIDLSSAMLAYTVVLVISLRLLRTSRPLPLRYLIALAPVVPVLWVPLAVMCFRDVTRLHARI
jgi:hypothetical protein